MKHLNTISLGQLRREIARFKDSPDDAEVFFGSGDLSFNQLKGREYKPNGNIATLINFEFNEVYVVKASFPR